MAWGNNVEITDFLGRTFINIEKADDDESITFTAVTGEKWKMHHYQDCCESVSIESIVGDLSDLIGSPILKAEEAISDKRPAELPAPQYEDESQTWTFYKLATIKGYVDIRWYGSSNGYYGEGVDIEKIMPVSH